MRVALPLLVLTPFTAAAFTDGLADFSLKDTVRNMPGMLKDNVRRFRVGCGEMWVNGKAAGVVRQRVQSGGSALNYEELQLLRRSGEDTAKLLKAGALWLFAPELFPVLLYFYPRALPSTFETEAGRERRRGTLARMRTTSALELLATIEEQRASATGRKALAAVEHCATAEQVLRASSASRALAYVQGSAVAIAPDAKTYKAYSQIAQREAKRRSRKNAKVKVGVTTGAGKVALNGLSQPALKAGCKLIGVCGPQPGPFRRGALGAHLEKLVHEDSILAVQGVRGRALDPRGLDLRALEHF